MTQTKQTKRAAETLLTQGTKIPGTVCIILSGFILYLDKVLPLLNIELTNLHGYNDQDFFVWSLMQTISPILIMMGLYISSYKASLIIPIYCYSIQFWFVLDSSLSMDNHLLWLYALGTTILVAAFILGLARFLERKRRIRNTKFKLMEAIIEADDKIIPRNEE